MFVNDHVHCESFTTFGQPIGSNLKVLTLSYTIFTFGRPHKLTVHNPPSPPQKNWGIKGLIRDIIYTLDIIKQYALLVLI